MRLRNFAIFVAGASALLAACGGDDETPDTPTPPPAAATPVPTATPLARIPEPIIVSGQGAPGGLTASEDAVQYTVESGDTVSGIAERFGVSSDAIRSANDLDGDDIFIGQTLTIPRSSTPQAGTGQTPGPTTPSAGENTYVVQAGDTAFGIALEFDTTVEALAAANGMTEDEITNLQIGQVINLPRPE